MKIGLIGAGRLGLCLALLMEEAGYDVIASDVRADYIASLNQKVIDTTEPEVKDLLRYSKNIYFTTDNQEVIHEADIIFTLVRTPSLENGRYDVSDVDDVISDVLKYAWTNPKCQHKSIVIGCTTNPGDCDFFEDRLSETGFDLFYNPEFIAQGSIINDLRMSDMVLVGGKGVHSREIQLIYGRIQRGFKIPSIHFMSTKAAEITKIAVNCFLTTKISYANMVGQVLSMSGLNDEINGVLKAIGSDDRIGNKYLNFGFGFGGPCFPRDNRAFAAYATDVGVKFNIGDTIDNFNQEHHTFLRYYYVRKNSKELPFCFKYLTYKPETDILVESQQYKLCLDLLDLGYKVYCTDLKIKDLCDERIIFDTPKENVCWIDF